jgi:hypothetical protein
MLWPALLVLASSPTAAHAALEKHCGSCHAGGEANEGGFDFLFDRDALVREQFVVPRRAAASRLVQRLNSREMPPPEAWAKVPAAEQKRRRAEALAALEAWIREGAPAEGFDAPKPVADDEPLGFEEVVHAALYDLGRVSRRSTARWFIVGSDESAALQKALNSLSWRPQLVQPVAAGRGLVRIDLDELGWSRETWEATLAAAYPFAVSTGSLEEETLSRATGSAVPVLRADWFVANATRPPLYHALLRLPSSEAGLESLLEVRVRDDIARAAVVRVGFSSSGVSQNNRLIERHSTRFGPYWRSYDFASNVGPRNLFERPLTFVHDGGEHIFSLPNGLFGYLLTDARGGRIDRAPTAIVRDVRRPDGAVENGLSCMGCHARGFIPKVDQVGRAVRASETGFDARERRLVDRLHPEGGAVQGLFELDTRRFLASLDELEVKVDEEEPVTRVALAYERDLDAARCAQELGVTPGALSRVLERGPESMGPLRLKGTVKRDAFVAVFPVLVARLHLGSTRELQAGRGGAAADCGLSGGSVEARAEACAIAFPERARHGPFRLVARDPRGQEVWLDEKRRLLWSPRGRAVRRAAGCGVAAVVEQGHHRGAQVQPAGPRGERERAERGREPARAAVAVRDANLARCARGYRPQATKLEAISPAGRSPAPAPPSPAPGASSRRRSLAPPARPCRRSARR